MLKNKVKELRDKMKISKAKLAREIGVCRSYVLKLENGTLQPSGEIMFRIAEFLDLRIDEIFEHVGGKDCRRKFFDTKTLPDGNTIKQFLISPGQAGGQQTGPSARPSSGNGAVKDKSLVGPTAKVVASLSRSKPNGKT